MNRKYFYPFALSFFSIFFLWASVASGANGRLQQLVDTSGLGEKLKTFIGQRGTDEPGAILSITQNGREIFHYATGSADLETGTLIDNNTVFEAASVSKQFTAACILLLVEGGKIKLSDDVRKYIPELPDYGTTIMISNLLTHTSGLKDWRNITYLQPVYTATRLYNQDMALELICRQSTLNFKPGDQYRYSNSGYDLLSAIIEIVSGESLSTFAKKHLLEPAGMKKSRFRDKYTDIVRNRATGYLKSGNKYLQGIVLDETCGAAGLYTTVSDLQKWNTFVNSGKVSNQFKTLRLTQGVLNNGRKIPYALGGVEVHTYNGQTEIRHGGLISGYRAWLAFYPGKNISVAYTSNDRSLATTILSDLTREFFFGRKTDTARFHDIVPGKKEMDAIAGKYQNLDDLAVSLELKIKDDSLMADDKPVKFINRNTLSISNQVYEIKKNQLIQLTDDGDYTFKKVGEVSEALQYARITGTYHSNDAGMDFVITYDGNELYAAGADSKKIKLVPLYQKENTSSFKGLSNGLRTIFHFTLNNAGDASLNVSLPRADLIPFVKIK